MEPVELRDLDAARRYVTEGLWLQRAVKPNAETVKNALEWAMEIAAGGHPLPPVGFVGDVGHIALGADSEHRSKDALHIPAWPPALVRMYEDHVLGKLYADLLFERAGDALQKYHDKDRIKGLAYIVNQIQSRANIPGVHLSPAVIRGLLTANMQEVLAAAWERLEREGPDPLLIMMYERLVTAGRRWAETLVLADLIAIENRLVLGENAQNVGLDHINKAKQAFLELLPNRPVRPYPNRKEVPTRIHDVDQYPIGGYESIATKGSIESLLQSQLAYIEDEAGPEPDLFDVKYARDELFYYSRDENQFLRRRRGFAFVLYPDLIALRFKDAELPYQRIVFLISAILAVAERLNVWLGKGSERNDSLRFEFLFLQDGEKKPLEEEAKWLKFSLPDQIKHHALVEHVAGAKQAVERLNRLAQDSQVHLLVAMTEPLELEMDNVMVTEVVVDGPVPKIGDGVGPVYALDGDDPLDVWQQTVRRILELWV
jgi:hypothetical protein